MSKRRLVSSYADCLNFKFLSSFVKYQIFYQRSKVIILLPLSMFTVGVQRLFQIPKGAAFIATYDMHATQEMQSHLVMALPTVSLFSHCKRFLHGFFPCFLADLFEEDIVMDRRLRSWVTGQVDKRDAINDVFYLWPTTIQGGKRIVRVPYMKSEEFSLGKNKVWSLFVNE